MRTVNGSTMAFSALRKAAGLGFEPRMRLHVARSLALRRPLPGPCKETGRDAGHVKPVLLADAVRVELLTSSSGH